MLFMKNLIAPEPTRPMESGLTPVPWGQRVMNGKRRRQRFDSELKAKVALEALRKEARVVDLALKYRVHPTQIYSWMKQLVRGAAQVFPTSEGRSSIRDDELRELYAKIGQLMVQRDVSAPRRRRKPSPTD